MRRFFVPCLALVGLAVFLGQTKPATTSAPASSPASAQATAPASKPVDYYAMTPAEFFKLPAVNQQIKKDFCDITLLEAAVFQDTNIERTKNKLPIFKHSWAMNLMARRHSTEMADLQFFDHVSPTPANATLNDRLKNVGLANVTAGENLAVLPAKEIGSGHYITHDPPGGNEVWYDEVTGKRVDYYTYKDLAQAVVDQWMKSPEHHANIVKKEYVFLGVGIVRGPYEPQKQDSFYMTQNFSATVTATSEEKAKAALAPTTKPQ
jgi:uncharacterized protein YkwD